MPALGLGLLRTSAQNTAGVVTAAIGAGYRLIDTAEGYLNERGVGDGIRASGIDRAEMFVASKLWIGHHGYEQTLRAFDGSLDRLGLDHLDLYLIHWPVPGDFDRTVASWRAITKLQADGRIRAIGTCNFQPGPLVAQTEVVPAVNQVELHPFFTNAAVREADQRLGIVTQAWSPIGGTITNRPDAGATENISPLQHPVIIEIAQRHAKSPA